MIADLTLTRAWNESGKPSVRMLVWLKWAEFLVLLKEREERA